MWHLTFAGWRVFERLSHRALSLALGPLLVMIGLAGMVLWGQGFSRPLIWLLVPVAGLGLMWTASAQIIWLQSFHQSPKTTGSLWCGRRGWLIVAVQTTLESLLLFLPALLISLDKPKWAGVIVAGFAASLSIGMVVVTRLKLVPILVAWHNRGWSSWVESWHLTRGKRQWSLGGAWVLASIFCQLPDLIVALYLKTNQHSILMDHFLLPSFQMLGGLAAAFWPLAIAAIFCQSVLPIDFTRKFQ